MAREMPSTANSERRPRLPSKSVPRKFPAAAGAATEEQIIVQRVARDEGIGRADKLAELMRSLAALRQSACLDVDQLLCPAEIGRYRDQVEFRSEQTLVEDLRLPAQTLPRHIKFLSHPGYLANIQRSGRRLRLALSQQGRKAGEEAAYVLAGRRSRGDTNLGRAAPTYYGIAAGHQPHPSAPARGLRRSMNLLHRDSSQSH